jgi:hypothetical protein
MKALLANARRETAAHLCVLPIHTLLSLTVQVLNDTYAVELRHLIRQGEREASDAQFISIDRLGADVRARFGTDYSVERVGFDQVEFLLICMSPQS